MIRFLVVVVLLAVGGAAAVHLGRNRLLASALPSVRARLRARFGDGVELEAAELDPAWTLNLTRLRLPLAGGLLLEVERARVGGVLWVLTPGGPERLRVAEARATLCFVGDEGPLSALTLPFTFEGSPDARRPIEGTLVVREAAWAHRREDLPAPPYFSGEAKLAAGSEGWTLSGVRVLVGDAVVEGGGGNQETSNGGARALVSVRQLTTPLADHLLALADPAIVAPWPGEVALEGEVELAAGVWRVRARAGTPESALTADAELSADMELGGKLTGKLGMADALALGLFPMPLKPLATGEVMLDASFEGTPGRPVLAGTAFTPSLELAAGPPAEFPVYRFSDTTISFRLERDTLVWTDFAAAGSSGRITGSGSIEFGIWPVQHASALAWEGVRLEEIPTGPGGAHALSGLLRGAISGKAQVIGQGGDPELLNAEGEVELAGPEYLFLRRLEPALAGYGLPAPPTAGSGPCRCRLKVSNARLEIEDLQGKLDGLSFSGRLVVALSTALSGRLVVTLEPEYVAKSRTLALGAALGPVDVPVTITGTLADPQVSVDIADAISGLLKQSRMGGAMAQAARTLFAARPPPRENDEMDSVFERILAGGEEADRLIDRLVSAGMSTDEVRERLADYRRRRDSN